MLRNSLSIVILLSAVIASWGQSDFVVTVKGDTLRGRIIFHQIGKVEQVQVKAGKNQTISSIQVRMASMRGKSYKPIQYSGSVQMMEILTNGYLSLLAFKLPGMMSYDGRLLVLRDGRMLEAPTIGFKKQVSNFLKDDPELSARIKEGELGRTDLDKIISGFNLFIESKTIVKMEEGAVETATKSKLETLDELRFKIENSEIDTKKETLEMLVEVKDKISNNKSIPQYLYNALKENLKSDTLFLEKLERLVKD